MAAQALVDFESKFNKLVVAKSFHQFCFGIDREDGSVEHVLYTKDEHDVFNPIKPFPDAAYLRVIADLLVVSGGMMKPDEAVYALDWGVPLDHLTHLYASRKLALEKSRQLKITWVVLAYLLWRAIFHEHQLIMVQSKRAADAAALVCERKDDTSSRLCVMERNLPPYLRSLNFNKIGVSLKGTLNFPNGSSIVAIPEGGSKIRSRTPSILFSDEAAFQPEFGEAYGACLPAVSGGGQAIFVSSAEMSDFQNIVGSTDEKEAQRLKLEDREGDDEYARMLDMPSSFHLVEGGMQRGLTTRIDPDSNLFVCRLYHTADPEKNPATPVGREWLYHEEQGYPGGVTGPKWQKEMGIKYTVGGGGRVFSEFGRWRQESMIFVPRINAVPPFTGVQVWGSYDHGFVNPCCYLVHLVYPRENDVWFQTVWELYADGLVVPEIAAIINGESIVSSDGREFQGNPFAGREVVKVCDPEIDRRTQTVGGEMKRVIDLFRTEGVTFVKGESGDDVTIVDYLKGTLWRNPYAPKYQIGDNCKSLIWEMGKLQYKDDKADIFRMQKNPGEKLVDKDNHAWDALKYFLKRMPRGHREPAQEQREGSFGWWMDLNRNTSFRGMPVQSRYRRM